MFIRIPLESSVSIIECASIIIESGVEFISVLTELKIVYFKIECPSVETKLKFNQHATEHFINE